MLELYRRARLAVVTLQEIHRFTGQRALLEALAMGKATVVARTQAVTRTYELKEGEEVFFYEPRNVRDLAGKVGTLYRDEKKIHEVGARARMFVEALPKDAFASGLRKIILETVNE